jgi:hypothetical protein
VYFLIKKKAVVSTLPTDQIQHCVTDCCLFPNIKMASKEGTFNITITQAKLQDTLAKFQKKHSECFEQLHDCWASCVKSQGNYFEGTILIER